MTYLEWVDDVIHDPVRSGKAGLSLALCCLTAVAAWHPLAAAPYDPDAPDAGFELPLGMLVLPFLAVGWTTFLLLSPLFFALHRAWSPESPDTPELDAAERERRLRALLPRLA